MEILHLKDLDDTESGYQKCGLCVNLIIDNFVCSFRYFTSVSNFKINRTITYVYFAF